MTRRIPRLLLLIAALILIAFLAGCGGGGSDEFIIDEDAFEPNYVSVLDGCLYHWDHVPVRASFDLPDNWAVLYDGQPLHTQAVDEWNVAEYRGAPVQMMRTVSWGSTTDVTVEFVARMPGSTLGETRYTYSPTTLRMVDAEITIALSDASGPMPAGDIRAVMAHELGHAIGIGGHSTTSTDLMYPTLQNPPQIAGVRDLNTMKTAYPSYFGGHAILREPMVEEEFVTVVIQSTRESIFGKAAR